MKRFFLKKYCQGLFVCAMALCVSASFTACGIEDEDEPQQEQPENPETPEEPEQPVAPEQPERPPLPITIPSFAKGADVSWLTQLEAEGMKYFNEKGVEEECMSLLKNDYDINSIRLRVWVNPTDGYNNIADVMKKARRAAELGLSLMIDFHFSDTWADPGNQTVPKAWAGLKPADMADAIKQHVTEMMTALANEEIAPAWVQIGNETSQGMLFESGKMKDQDAGEFPRYLNAGYDAVKAISPETKVIVHLPNGHDSGLYRWFFDLVNKNGGKYDIIGMSLYPESDTWPVQTLEEQVDKCMANINDMKARYGKEVMLCEIGFHYTRGTEAYRVIRRIIDERDFETLNGIFYWEPEAPAHYNGGYDKGCVENGRFNDALKAFRPTR